MNTATCIPGKDSPLESTLEHARTALGKLGIELNETSYLNPVPHCWSVHLQAASCRALYTNGKGTTKLSSIASGVGEFIERLATDFFFSEYFIDENNEETTASNFTFYPDELWFTSQSANSDIADYHSLSGNAQLLNPELFDFYDPEGELQAENLLDNNTDPSRRGICALPFTHLEDASLCYFPISLLNNLYVSNGMAAGNSSSECRSQALSEIIERYVKNTVIADGLSLPIIPDTILENSPHLLDIKHNIEQHGFSVTIHDSSLGGQFPVICVTLIDKNNGGTYAAFGANCRFETAIERTLTELLQGRKLDQLHDFSHPVHNPELVADSYNLESHFIDSNGLLSWSMFRDLPDHPFSPWSFSGSTTDEEQYLRRIISQNGFTAYLREYHHCGLYTCRIIIPGMSEIYPVDDLIWNNRNKGARLRPLILQLPEMKDQQLLDLLDTIEELEFDDQQLLSHLIGILFDEESNWATLRIGELKAHIYLALNDYENAQQWCGWVIDYGEISETRRRTFQTLSNLIHFHEKGEDTTLYRKGLRRFYTEEEIEISQTIIEGDQTFFGLHFDDSWTKISTAHSSLLKIYNTLAKAKARLPQKQYKLKNHK